MKRTDAMQELSTTFWVKSATEHRFISVEVARDAIYFAPVNRKILWVNV